MRHAVKQSGRFFFPLLIFAGLVISMSSCTSFLPAKLAVSRPNDTLSVWLNSPRWDSRKDSLVLICPGCNPKQSRIVERFERGNSAFFEVPPSEALTLTLYTMGKEDTVINLPSIGTWDTAKPSPSFNQIWARRNRANATLGNTATIATTKEHAPAKSTKSPTALKVTAAEGVAIYKDKTKKEVLKIVPQGTVLTLLSREGDLYSVGIEGGEGFVEAEAVRILE